MNKIDGISSVKSIMAKGSQPQAPTAPLSQSGAGQSDSDSNVVLTAAAQRMQEAEQQLRQYPEVDAERVSAIKAAVEEGRYSVDPERVATKLLDIEQILK